MWLLKGGTLCCPLTGRSGQADLRVEGGHITEIGPGLEPRGERFVQCAGLTLIPALVDLASELGDPGETWREDLRSGGAAAAAGGFGTVVVSPNTAPAIDSASAVQDLLSRAGGLSGARLRVAGALTAALAGRELAELNDLVEAGAVALSDGGRGMGDALVLRNALDYARPLGVPVFTRPCEPTLEERGAMHEGEVSAAIGLHGIPAASEEIGVLRTLALARLTGCAVHLSHVTTARGVELLRQARAEGLAVTSAVPARHLLLTDQDIDDMEYNSNLRLLPPLRPERDRAAVVRAVQEGVIDVVSADHVPWTRVEKEQEFMLASPGAVGLESAFAAAMTALGDLELVVMAMSARPAARIGQRAALEVGALADLALVDPDERAPLPCPRFSRGMNEPLAGRSLRGRVHATFVAGALAWANPALVIR